MKLPFRAVVVVNESPIHSMWRFEAASSKGMPEDVDVRPRTRQ
ncbi:MAG: hypothetical protein R3268_10680 [Acidiferrobacterales bacterium]|nr:hypothetical protein [Acidiferrobacterales bacterium]